MYVFTKDLNSRYFINWFFLLPSHFAYAFLPGYFLLAPLMTFSGYSWTLDTLTRVNPNDTYAGSYYFWWTNLTYLPLFFFLFVFMLSYITANIRQLNAGVSILYLALLFYSVELVDYLVLNSLDSSVVYSYYGINTLLTNVLNRYHPLVFYFSVGLLIVACFGLLKSYLLKKERLSTIANLHAPYNIIWLLVTVNLVALWMGSWWALQEGTWGGWWNWDSSEMFGLLVSFVGLSLHHTNWYAKSKATVLFKFLFLLNCVVSSYFFIQLNFDLVSHNFGAKFFSIFNDNLFFVEALFFTLLYMLIHFYELRVWKRTANSFTIPSWVTNVRTLFFKSLILFIAVSWVGWSYKPLLNYFLWNFAELNALNSDLSLQPINFLAMLILFLWLIKINSSLTSTNVLLLAFTPHWLFSGLISLRSRSKYSLLHSPLLLISLLSLALYDLSFTYWIPLTPYEIFYSNSYSYLPITKEWVLDTNLFDSIGLWLAFDGSYFVMWNAFINANSPAINFFMLVFSHSTFENLYILGTLYSSPTLILEIPSILTLNFLFLLLLITKQAILWLATPKIKI